jgi:hypothetical protein
MLHTETVSILVLDLIRNLQKDPVFEAFHLVGGTALALQIGHRTSIDIDFFSRESFDAGSITEHLEKEYAFSQQRPHLTNSPIGTIQALSKLFENQRDKVGRASLTAFLGRY